VDITLPQIPRRRQRRKILIYNEKELNKPVGILYAPLAFYRAATTAGRFLSLRERVRGGERTGVICASQDCKFGINISRARPTVVEIDPGDSLPDRGENESGIVATVNGLAGFFVQR
jgi:hypothetical protein